MYSFTFAVKLGGETKEHEVKVSAHDLRAAWVKVGGVIVDEFNVEDLHEGEYRLEFVHSNCPVPAEMLTPA
jgi:hypothetical protein